MPLVMQSRARCRNKWISFFQRMKKIEIRMSMGSELAVTEPRACVRTLCQPKLARVVPAAERGGRGQRVQEWPGLPGACRKRTLALALHTRRPHWQQCLPKGGATNCPTHPALSCRLSQDWPVRKGWVSGGQGRCQERRLWLYLALPRALK